MAQSPKRQNLSAEEKIQKYYMNSENSDVTFIVGGQKLPAHRFIMAMESEYFQKLLYSANFSESKSNEIPLKQTPLVAFDIILKHMYCRDINWNFDIGTCIELLELCRRYMIKQLEDEVVNVLKNKLDIHTVFHVVNAAEMFELQELEQGCRTIIDENTEDVFSSKFLSSLSIETLCVVLRRRTKKIPELTVFVLVHEWIKACDPPLSEDKVAEVMQCLDISKISPLDIVRVVYPTKLLSPEFLMDVMQVTDQNIATEENGLKVLKGYRTINNISSDDKYIKAFKCNPIKWEIKIDIGFINHINNIQFMLKEKTKYTLELSLDDRTYKTIIDYSKYICFNKQDLYFPTTIARYVKITSTETFECNALKIFRKSTSPKLEDQFVCPFENVCTVDKVSMNGTCPVNILARNLIKKRLQAPNVLKYHMSETFTIQFNQPYWINTLVVTLCDYDGQKQAVKVWSKAGQHKCQDQISIWKIDSQEDTKYVFKGEKQSINTICISFMGNIKTQIYNRQVFRLAYIEAYYTT